MNEPLSAMKPAVSKLARLTTDSRGQVLPLTLVALALGTLLVSPFLVNASANLLAGRSIDVVVKETYSADAGIEWGLWHLKSNPVLTTSTDYTETPLQPTPAAINGSTFPTTDIRYVQGAGMSNSIAPTWQVGSGPKCYPFQSTDAGSIFATVTFGGGQIWMDLLAGSAPCQRSAGLAPMGGVSPYVAQFLGKPAGSYQLMVETSPAGTGPVVISYPVATYDIRSQANGRTTTARATASYDAVRVFSWQLN